MTDRPKHYYKAIIQYDGSEHAGFQWQKGIPSLQNDFNLALQKLVEGKITTMSASRTDTGVHAMEQVVKVTSENTIDCMTILERFNQVLIPQIQCLKFEACSSDFKPASDPISKEYRYFFTNELNYSPKERKYISNFPKELNYAAIHECLEAILGTHNFQNFCSAGSNVKSTVRNISFCELKEIDPHQFFNGSTLFPISDDIRLCFELRIVGDGFLKQMIRHIVSAIWMVGSGRYTTKEFHEFLTGPKQSKRLWKVAPPNGLFLYKITYSPK